MNEKDYANDPETQGYEQRVYNWVLNCFGTKIANDPEQRLNRFGEESIELYQSLGGTKENFLKLVDYVFDRPAGEPFQETGGVMLTLAGLCFVNNIPMNTAAETELKRVWSMIDTIREKEGTRVAGSVLTGNITVDKGFSNVMGFVPFKIHDNVEYPFDDNADTRMLSAEILSELEFSQAREANGVFYFTKGEHAIDTAGNYYRSKVNNSFEFKSTNIYTVYSLQRIMSAEVTIIN